MARVDDECVEYFLFPRLPTVKAGNPVKNALEDFRASYRAHLAQYLDDYLWQKESFALSVVDVTGGTTPPHLHGCTNFGCNVDDEWFIVFLLFELTKAFPDLIIRVIDSDGEFLLIEMADQIPKWLNPDSAVNRVLLYQGNVHIVPRPTETGPLSSLPSSAISQSESVTAVREFSHLTKCDAKTQRAVWRRTGAFPDKIQENRHYAHCFIPANVAVILKEAPWLLPFAINAFHERDALDLEACRMMRYFPPETRVLRGVNFTRCLYAQLSSNRFEVDSRIGWKIPPPKSPQFKAFDLGMKLASGFEILVVKAKHRSARNGSFDQTDARWLRFINTLKDKGFFRGELEGSKLHHELMNKAKRHFLDDIASANGNYASDQILELLDSIHVDMEELEKEAKCLPPADNDNWMELSSQQLDDILRNKWGSEMDSNIASTITSSLNTFVNHRSDIEGAEIPTKLREKPKRGNKSNRVTLDPDSFGETMNSILDFKVPEWEEGSSSDMSEYSDEDDEELGETGERKRAEFKPSNVVNHLKNYMESMDRELAQTTVGQSFERQQNTGNVGGDANLDHYSPVDVDLTALCNILESYRSQGAEAGPASNLLTSMGVQLPQNADD